jgi:hypothetical protein
MLILLTDAIFRSLSLLMFLSTAYFAVLFGLMRLKTGGRIYRFIAPQALWLCGLIDPRSLTSDTLKFLASYGKEKFGSIDGSVLAQALLRTYRKDGAGEEFQMMLGTCIRGSGNPVQKKVLGRMFLRDARVYTHELFDLLELYDIEVGSQLRAKVAFDPKGRANMPTEADGWNAAVREGWAARGRRVPNLRKRAVRERKTQRAP